MQKQQMQMLPREKGSKRQESAVEIFNFILISVPTLPFWVPKRTSCDSISCTKGIPKMETLRALVKKSSTKRVPTREGITDAVPRPTPNPNPNPGPQINETGRLSCCARVQTKKPCIAFEDGF